MERFGDDPLPFWQRAYELAKRGDYLPDEAYSEWAEARREEIAGLRRQSVLALARLFTEREGRAGEEQALVLLRSYWTAHPRDEDILRPLMEALGKRECYQEALDSYAKLCDLLSEDGQQPDPRTQDVAAYLRSKQLQRPRSGPRESPTVVQIVVLAFVSPFPAQSTSPGASCERGERERTEEGIAPDGHHIHHEYPEEEGERMT